MARPRRQRTVERRKPLVGDKVRFDGLLVKTVAYEITGVTRFMVYIRFVGSNTPTGVPIGRFYELEPVWIDENTNSRR